MRRRLPLSANAISNSRGESAERAPARTHNKSTTRTVVHERVERQARGGVLLGERADLREVAQVERGALEHLQRQGGGGGDVRCCASLWWDVTLLSSVVE